LSLASKIFYREDNATIVAHYNTTGTVTDQLLTYFPPIFCRKSQMTNWKLFSLNATAPKIWMPTPIPNWGALLLALLRAY
jgi:hypothetical protein